MYARLWTAQPRQGPGFNMTPLIDMVFLLITFFMLVCNFMAAENFPVDVPDRIASARPEEERPGQTPVVTVMLDEGGGASYAVGSTVLSPLQGPAMSRAIAAAIDEQLGSLSTERRTVTLRCDRAVPFRYAKHALAGVSVSSAADVQWAVIRRKGD